MKPVLPCVQVNSQKIFFEHNLVLNQVNSSMSQLIRALKEEYSIKRSFPPLNCQASLEPGLLTLQSELSHLHLV